MNRYFSPLTEPAPKFIDMTPSWGEWGNVYRRLAEGRAPVGVLKGLAHDFARTMAACEALNALGSTLTPEQAATVKRVMAEELHKQGFASVPQLED